MIKDMKNTNTRIAVLLAASAVIAANKKSQKLIKNILEESKNIKKEIEKIINLVKKSMEV